MQYEVVNNSLKCIFLRTNMLELMIEFLKPISEKHSISRVVASVYIPQIFLKPKDVFEKLKEQNVLKEYPKKELLKSTTINFHPTGVGISNDEVGGFVFESYDARGAVKDIFKLENIREKQSVISLENRSYSNWNSFLKKWAKDLGEFSSANDFYVEAIGLNYRDEFLWTSNEHKIAVKEIFNIQSELLNDKFINSRNGTCVLISQNGEHGEIFEEKTEISFNNDLRRIVVDHQYAHRFEDIQLFKSLKENKGFIELYERAHLGNKNFLKDILTQEVQRLIGLI